MTIERTTHDSFQTDLPLGPATGEVPEFNEVQQLAWDVCDGVIADDELRRLEDLLRESHEARSDYISVMSIHQSLIKIFNPLTYSPPHGLLPN